MIGRTTITLIGAMAASVLTGAAYAQCSSDGRFMVDSENGTVTDHKTGLMWQQCAMGLSGTNCGAGEAAKLSLEDTREAITFSATTNHSNWRLPTVKELNSIVDVRCYAPSIQEDIFPNTPAHYFWTDIKFNDDTRKSWVVSFYFGEDGVAFESLGLHSRLVRNIDSFAQQP